MAFQTINDVLYLDSQAFTTSTGDNDDLALSSSNLQVTCTSDGDRLTGLIPPLNSDGAQVWVQNASPSNTLEIPNNDGGSTAGFRFILLGGSTLLTLEPGQCQHFGLLPGTGWIPLRPGTFS